MLLCALVVLVVHTSQVQAKKRVMVWTTDDAANTKYVVLMVRTVF